MSQSLYTTSDMQSLEADLWVSARSVVQALGMDFTVPCAHNLRDFIEAGIRNLIRLNRMDLEARDLAETNLRKLVDAMVAATRTTNEPIPAGKGARPIRETAFVKAKLLCPLWPFC